MSESDRTKLAAPQLTPGSARSGFEPEEFLAPAR